MFTSTPDGRLVEFARACDAIRVESFMVDTMLCFVENNAQFHFRFLVVEHHGLYTRV
jgi:hypothetical protein